MDPLISQLSAALPAAKSLEQLTRPLLQMLGAVTGMESTYLTSVSLADDVQRVEFARNSGNMVIPEGLEVTWSDTLCKRALDEDCLFTNEVSDRWGDSDAAKALGIQTYLSAPVRAEDGHLLGTICAASAVTKPINTDAQTVITLFSSLVASFIERELLMTQLQQANQQLLDVAMRDALTGLPNRRALYDKLDRMLSGAAQDKETVLVGLLDLDGFKQINDVHGHLAGDAFLRAVGQRIAGTMRPGDIVGRLGGDEFLILAPGPDENAAMAADTLQLRTQAASMGEYDLLGERLSYAGASVGVVAVRPGDDMDADRAVRMADARMYEIKRIRRGVLAR